jgi:uncharacterized protein (DUF1810 family)
MPDTFNVQRFVDAQQPVIAQVERELLAGHKVTHWMWFVFPQLAGVGTSAMSARYAINSLEEARAYLDHPLLGPRLRRCVQLVLEVKGRSAYAIFGEPDDAKFRSCLTLFGAATEANAEFVQALERYYDGEPDEETLRLLRP